MSQPNSYQAYFTRFLPSIYGELLIEDLKDLTACFEIAVKDSADSPWRLAIENGRLVHVGHDGPDPGCRFELDSATLLRVASASETPQEAFFDMRIELTGDIELGLKLSTVLEPFFQRFPYKPEEETSC